MELIGTIDSAEVAGKPGAGGARPAARVAVLLALIVAAAVALRGRMPDQRPAGEPEAADSPGSLAAMVALLGVAMVVMAFAVFARRPPLPKPAPQEIRDHSGGGPGWIRLRPVLIVLGFVVLWLALLAVFSQLRIGHDLVGPDTAPAPVPDSPGQGAPRTPARAPEADGDSYRLLVLATAGLLLMMVAATVVTALRNRVPVPPVALVGGPDEAEPGADAPLVAAAERGLAEVANPALRPREAIIACYAAMERALAEAPGAAPQASDTPSEVLARAVGNRAVRAGNAAALVELFAEARFSGHVMTEDHRVAAERALRSVLAELRSAA